MNSEEFRIHAKQLIDYVANYLDNIRDRRPLSNVEPGYLQKLIPDQTPVEGEKWEEVFKDIERVIMPGITQWHSPQFHAYFPTANSYPAICADILSDSIGCIGFSWVSSPACTELEIAMMKWLAKLVELPQVFDNVNGGGIIQNSASDSTYVSLLAARSKVLYDHCLDDKGQKGSKITSEAKHMVMSKVVMYCSDQAHSSVERAGLLAMVRIRKVESDGRFRMRGEKLKQAIDGDKGRGLIPFLCVATLGTTPTCAFDNLEEIGPICAEENIWLHIDAAYAGNAFVCPEFRHFMAGLELADSYSFNPHKWLCINFDCSILWLKDSRFLIDSFNVDPLYLKHANQTNSLDLRHWQISLGRRFRSLKVWFVLRMYGQKGLQEYIRKDIRLAKEFEELVRGDNRFEIINDVYMGLVCFRLKGGNAHNQLLLDRINKDGRIYLVPSESKGVYYLRWVVCAASTQTKDVEFAWKVIYEIANALSNKNENEFK